MAGATTDVQGPPGRRGQHLLESGREGHDVGALTYSFNSNTCPNVCWGVLERAMVTFQDDVLLVLSSKVL